MNQFHQQSYSQVVGNWLNTFWRFSRPQTMITTSLTVWGLYFLTLGVTNSKFPGVHLSQVFITWIACLCGNIYIVGLNQVEDIEIDKINHPDLPLVSGDFTKEQGQLIVIISGILALVISWVTSPSLFWMILISLVIGTAYSLPPIRLKRYPFWAALSIFSVRGTIVNLGLFSHFSWLFQKSQGISSALWVLTVFILVFSFAMKIFQDIPDLPGNKTYNLTNLTIELKPKRVFYLALWVVIICYTGMMITAWLKIAPVNSLFLIITHLIILIYVWWHGAGVNVQDQRETSQFYQLIGKLFFLEYVLFPIACLLG